MQTNVYVNLIISVIVSQKHGSDSRMIQRLHCPCLSAVDKCLASTPMPRLVHSLAHEGGRHEGNDHAAKDDQRTQQEPCFSEAIGQGEKR